ATIIKKAQSAALIWFDIATVCISATVFAGAKISLLAIAVLKRSACARKPIFGFSWKIFCQPAVMEVMNRNTVGIIVTQTYFCFFILNRMTVPRMSAIAAKIWLP